MTDPKDAKPHPLLWTPGPWKVVEEQHFNRDTIWKISIEPQIFYTYCLTKKTHERVLHDYSLISAAPELYEILAEILDNAVVNYVYREKAERIMAKARGEDPDDGRGA